MNEITIILQSGIEIFLVSLNSLVAKTAIIDKIKVIPILIQVEVLNGKKIFSEDVNKSLGGINSCGLENIFEIFLII